MTDWIAAYNRLYKYLDGYTGSQFIKTVQQVDPDLYDYGDYIELRRQQDKSTTKKHYFKDIILSYPDAVKHHLFETFLTPVEQANPSDAKSIRAILRGDKVPISTEVFAKVTSSKEVDETLSVETLNDLKS